jgi:DtxR family Mn-dependent transcriptional regulator
MKRLAALGLVNYKKSRGVTLTDEGQKIALETLRRHRLIELYLTEELGFGWDEVHEQAELLEHLISSRLEERIADVLGHPEFDPHGDPIPSKKGVRLSLGTQKGSPLSRKAVRRLCRV